MTKVVREAQRVFDNMHAMTAASSDKVVKKGEIDSQEHRGCRRRRDLAPTFGSLYSNQTR